MEDIPNKLQNTMGIIADVNLRKDMDGECIEITVPSYPVGITYKGVYYYRSGSTLQRLTGPALTNQVSLFRSAFTMTSFMWLISAACLKTGHWII